MDSEISVEIGMGMAQYFMMVKQMIIFLIICTILSIPAFVFFTSGEEGNVWKDQKVLFSTLTLGNIGQS
jgi:hypothetical protein